MSSFSKIYHGTSLLGPATIDPSTPGYVSNWAERLLAKLYQQFADKPNILALIRDVFAPQIQAFENAAQSLVTIASIDDSEGVQLDVLGSIIGQPRSGVSDFVYRPYLKARVKANKSSGSHNDIYAVFFLLYGGGTSMEITDDPGHTAIELTINDTITATQAAAGIGFLRDSKASGVKATLSWHEDEDVFRFDIGPGFDQGHFGGSAS